MTEQGIVILLMLLMPYRFEAEMNPPDNMRVQAREQMVLLEKETRRWRQIKTGKGL